LTPTTVHVRRFVCVVVVVVVVVAAADGREERTVVASRPMFREELVGGPKRELHNAGVVSAVLAEPSRVGELFDCALDPDEYVRMRAADALEKVCHQDPAIVAPICGRVLAELAASDQPSVQWHVAQILGQVPLDGRQRWRAVQVVRRYLETSGDWIVLSHSMDTLAGFAEHDPSLRRAIDPSLARLVGDPRKAVAKHARRIRERLGLADVPSRPVDVRGAGAPPSGSTLFC